MIDFVVLWVDGEDKKWQEKKESFLKSDKNSTFNGNDKNVRYRDYGTLKFFFRSVAKYAKWVHRIYLITDNQCPRWLNTQNPTVKIIDHKDFIPKEYLPVFNSNTIELNIGNIDELAENFVLFNDDMFLNKEVKAKDFFKDGIPLDYRIYTDILPKEDFNHIQMNNDILINKFVENRWPLCSKGLFNFKYGIQWIKDIIFLMQAKKTGIPGYVEPHCPLNFKKSNFKKAQEIWPDAFMKVNNNRFRSMTDISQWLVRHLQLELGDFVPSAVSDRRCYNIDQIDLIKKDLIKSKSKLLCINDQDVNNYDKLSKEVYNLLINKFPEKCEFEL